MAERTPRHQYSLRRLLLAVFVGGLCLGLVRVMGPLLGTLIAVFAVLAVFWWRVLLIFPIVYLGVLFLMVYAQETYLPIAPSIDTRYAPGYSEEAFDRLAPGDLAETVRAALGEPLEIVFDPSSPGIEVWHYSADENLRWLDFAWLGRSTTMRDGRVVSINRHVWYD